MTRKVVHAHWRVAQLATEMAHEIYAELMRRNDWYDSWKKSHPNVSSTKRLEEIWVKRHQHKFIEGARHTLAGMLAMPYDSDLKDAVHEALVLDATLSRGRTKTAYN
jgi:hypothetical protein